MRKLKTPEEIIGDSLPALTKFEFEVVSDIIKFTQRDALEYAAENTANGLDEKLLNRIKEEEAQKQFKESWNEIDSIEQHLDLWPEVFRRYAEEVNKIELSQYAYERDKARQERDKAENEISQLKKQNVFMSDWIALQKRNRLEASKLIRRAVDEISQLKKQLEHQKLVSQEMIEKYRNLESKLEVKEKPDFEKDWDQENANHPQGLNPYAFVYGEKIAWIKYVIPRDAKIFADEDRHKNEIEMRDAAISERDKELIEADRQLNIKKQQLAERDEKIKELGWKVDELNEYIRVVEEKSTEAIENLIKSRIAFCKASLEKDAENSDIQPLNNFDL